MSRTRRPLAETISGGLAAAGDGPGGVDVRPERAPFVAVVVRALGRDEPRVVEIGGDRCATRRRRRESGDDRVAVAPRTFCRKSLSVVGGERLRSPRSPRDGRNLRRLTVETMASSKARAGGAPWARRPAAALVFALGLMPAAAAAAEPAWSLRLSPAVWGASLDGETRFRGRRLVETDAAAFGDLSAVAYVDGEVRWRRLGVLADVTVLDIGESASAASLSGDLDVEGVVAALAGFWRVARTERWSVDALAGLRYWSIDTALTLRGAVSAERGERWADPLIGARANLRLGQRWRLEARGDVGGFGVGSDLQWEAVGRVAFTVTDHVAVAAGWRHLAFDYEEGDFALDATLTGPFLTIDLGF